MRRLDCLACRYHQTVSSVLPWRATVLETCLHLTVPAEGGRFGKEIRAWYKRQPTRIPAPAWCPLDQIEQDGRGAT